MDASFHVGVVAKAAQKKKIILQLVGMYLYPATPNNKL